MWNFLKADLQELVAVVKEDAASLGIPVVEGNGDDSNNEENKYQQQPAVPHKSPAQKEAERRMNIPETFTVSLLPRNRSKKSDGVAIVEGEVDVTAEPQINNDMEKTAEENDEVNPLLSQKNEGSNDLESVNESTTIKGITKDSTIEGEEEEEDDNDDDEDDDVFMDEDEILQIQEFLDTFNIHDEQIQQDITDLLNRYSQTLQVQFQTLVPEYVSEQEFWERYYYRCDVNRIEIEWDHEEKRNRETRKKIVTSVTSFFGDAARAVATGMSNALTEDSQLTYDDDDDGDGDELRNKKEISSTASGLTNIFGNAASSHRPPFVMNTAVDEDDEEEEEEIGWDDEDDDDEEQIVFDDNTGGPVMAAKPRSVIENDVPQSNHFNNNNETVLLCEQLKEQLKQAIEERDILHQTVSLQTKEIASLKSAASAENTDTATPNQGTTDANIDNVKQMQLLESQIQELSSLVGDRDNQIVEMKNQYETDNKALLERCHDLQMVNDELRDQIHQSERTAIVERNEMNETMARFESEKSDLESQLQMTQSGFMVPQTTITNLQTELDAIQQQNLVLNNTIIDLNNNNHHHHDTNTGAHSAVVLSSTTTTHTIVEDVAADAASSVTNLSSSGELTTATGVKISSPLESNIPMQTTATTDDAEEEEEEEEEGWGDEWD